MTKLRENQKILLEFIRDNEEHLNGVSIGDILSNLPGSGGQGLVSTRRTNINKTLLYLCSKSLLIRTRVLCNKISQFRYRTYKQER